MEESVFAAWINQYFPALTLRITERYNDEKALPTYMYRRFLRKEFSIDGKWSTLNVNNQLIAADVIAMDSSIPLKTRPSLGRASGDIPKMGLEMAIREKQLTDIHTLIALNRPESQIVAKIFADFPLVVGGQYERIEAMFLEGLSSGVTEIDDTETVGTGIRINYGYLPENMFESAVSWDDPTATPFTDIQQVLDKASLDGNAITKVMLDRATLNNITKTDEGKQIWAAAFGFYGTNIPVPTFDQMNAAVSSRFGFTFEIVERSVRLQRNGVNTTVRPWKSGSVIFLTTEQIGSLVYARLAEQDSPVAGVSYTTVDDFILVSKFRTNRPSLAEFTNSQSRVIPVIDNTDSIYLLDSTQDAG